MSDTYIDIHNEEHIWKVETGKCTFQ